MILDTPHKRNPISPKSLKKPKNFAQSLQNPAYFTTLLHTSVIVSIPNLTIQFLKSGVSAKHVVAENIDLANAFLDGDIMFISKNRRSIRDS